VGGNFQRADLGSWYDPGNPFTFARGHIFNALQFEDDPRSLIENAVGGSGDDIFWGNTAANIFWGNEGADTFYDSAGSDTYHGGGGLDLLSFDDDYSFFSSSAMRSISFTTQSRPLPSTGRATASVS
jgi:serralysin